MPALFSTTEDVNHAGAATACPSARAASFVIVHNERQQSRAVSRPALRGFSHIRFQIGGVTSSPCRRQASFPLPRGAGQPYPVERFRSARGAFPFARVGCRLPVQSLPHQQLVEISADGVHFQNALSSSACLDGFDANGKALTIGTISLPPRGKRHD